MKLQVQITLSDEDTEAVVWAFQKTNSEIPEQIVVGYEPEQVQVGTTEEQVQVGTTDGQVQVGVDDNNQPIYETQQVPVFETQQVPVYQTRQKEILGPNPARWASPEAYFAARCGDLGGNYRRQMLDAGVTPAPAPAPAPSPAPGVQVLTVTRKQGLKALLRATEVGMPFPVLESQIVAAINSMPETTNAQKVTKYDTLYEFQNAKTWNLTNPFTLGLQHMLQMSDAQRDALFNLGATFTE